MQPEKNLVSVGAEVPTRVTVIRPPDRTRETGQTPGMTREEAIRTSSQWAGYVRTAARMTSG